MARPYRPNPRPSLGATAAMICAGVGMALLLSVAWPLLGRLGTFLILGTVVPALLIGWVLALVAERTVFAHARAASAIAVLATALALIGGHYQQYREVRADLLADASERWNLSLSFGQPMEDIDQAYKETVNGITFANYLRAYFSDEDGAGTKIGPTLGVGLYLFELLIALLVSAYYPEGRASEPACAQCRRWYSFSEPRRAAHGVSKPFIAALTTGAREQALALLEPPDTAESVRLQLANCPGACDAPAILRVADESRPRSGSASIVRHRADLVLSLEDEQALEAWG